MRQFIWDPWRTAGRFPEKPAVVVGEQRCTFAEITRRADHYIEMLMSEGLSDGDVVAAGMPPGSEFFALCLAALRGGFGLFPLDRELPGPIQAALLHEAGTRLEVDDKAGGDGRVARWMPVDGDVRPGVRGTPPRIVRAGFLVLTTSGTTGQPKLVKRARPWYPYRGVAVSPRYAAGPELGAHLMCNPVFNLGSLGAALYALQAGSTVVVMSQWSAPAFWDLAECYSADSAYLTNRMLRDVVTAGIRPKRMFKALMHGGSSCALSVKRKAIELFGPVVHEYYATSAGVISEITSEEWLRFPGSVGRPSPGVRVSIERNGIPVPTGEVGEIVVALRSSDGGAGAVTGMAVGDVGLLDQDGYIYVLGRTSGSYAESMLEHRVRGLAGVIDAVVFTPPSADSTVRCLVEAEEAVLTQVQTQVVNLAARAGVDPLTVEIRPDGYFPRTASGKLRRVTIT